jgi:predicted enzyme related to lactoylglutathione lyase
MMARVTGIGGIFFKARDPGAIQAWYRDRLGIDMEPEQPSATFQWRHHDDPDRPGMTVWGIFPEDTSYFGSGAQPYMVNFRVDDLEGLLGRLRANGVEVAGGIEEYPYGRFAWVVDPEGNRVELWEPKGH